MAGFGHNTYGQDWGSYEARRDWLLNLSWPAPSYCKKYGMAYNLPNCKQQLLCQLKSHISLGIQSGGNNTPVMECEMNIGSQKKKLNKYQIKSKE
jgi:hypothetical protein